MAQKRTRQDIYEATQSFLYRGTEMVIAGQTVVSGHPLLRGRMHLFRPFVPTYGSLTPEPEEAEPEKVEAS